MKDMFDMSPEVARAVEALGYESPTPIQALAIPPMKAGRDVIGQAQTGTGKTAAFGIPLSDMIDPGTKRVQALVLCPTRELAMQTAQEITKLNQFRPGVIVAAVYGGAPIERQFRALGMGAQVVVGTPGRVMDHMNRGTLDLSELKLAILDEADEMLDMGFRDDIETILGATPPTRQTGLFSATMPPQILSLGEKYLRDPEKLTVPAETLTVEKIEQYYIAIRSFHKCELLSRLLLMDDVKRALVFVNTKQGVEGVVTDLQQRGFSAAGLHGDMRQIERDAVMARYKSGLVGVLVATDVAARGLDIDDIEVVFNYDVPLDVEYYVHRIGRTGRAGKEGRAYTFVVGPEVRRMWDYRRLTGATILSRPAPDGRAVRAAMMKRLTQRVESAAAQASDDARALSDELIEKLGAEQAVAALMDLLIAGSAQSNAALDLSVPEPVRTPRPRQKAEPVRRVGPYGRPVPPEMLARAQRDEAGPRDRRPARLYRDRDDRREAERRPFKGARNGAHDQRSASAREAFTRRAAERPSISLNRRPPMSKQGGAPHHPKKIHRD